ncbi:CGNR zinc finger domain-containing protein [Streptomyces marokkonensis]|uniref:CGNR zinc finger domain-containing protein n=1 Tax=Streptomyces marokkonensis TaxID=324855 RepID=A0ABW6QC22_9ACTN
MRDSITRDARLALDLALTVRHDGDGGVTDDLTEPSALTAWVRARPDAFPRPEHFVAGITHLTAVRDLRTALRTLFAHAVRPARPSPADAARLLPVPEALRRLNEAAARTPTVPVLDWAEGDGPVERRRPVPDGGHDPAAVLAQAAIGFLAGPDRERLRACHAPRCVRYFLKEHPRQEWCRPSCGNRARVARHHERHRRAGQGVPGT